MSDGMVIAWIVWLAITGILTVLELIVSIHEGWESGTKKLMERKKKAVIQALRQSGFNADVACQIADRLEQSGDLNRPLPECIQEALREGRERANVG